MTWHISPRPTCIAKFVDGDFCGGELWVSGTFDNMADWLANNGFDVQVARLELCCPCCRIFETSTSQKFWSGRACRVGQRIACPRSSTACLDATRSESHCHTLGPLEPPCREGEGKGGWLVGGWGWSAVSLQSVSGGDGGREGREGGPGGRAAPAPHIT